MPSEGLPLPTRAQANARSNQGQQKRAENPLGLPDKPTKATKPGLCETISAAKAQAEQQHKARASHPQPWILLKFTIAIALGILGYASYVYIGRFCIPMIHGNRNTLGNPTLGAVFVAVYAALLLMVTWTYVKVLVTPPGKAPDYVAKSPRPVLVSPTRGAPVESADDGSEFGAAYDHMVTMDSSYQERQHQTFTVARPQPSKDLSAPAEPRPLHLAEKPSTLRPSHDLRAPYDFERAPSTLGRTHSRSRSQQIDRRPSHGTSQRRPSLSSQSRRPSVSSTSQRRQPSSVGRETSETTSVMDALPPVAALEAKAGVESEARPTAMNGVPATNPSNKPILSITRRPIGTPVLLPAYRYCSKCEIIKPKRTHHCRACGTCVLKYDHHCPWIGQCVGARNHKFFIHFLQWSVIMCIWILGTLIGRIATNPPAEIDPQQIVTIALAGLFGLFTGGLLVSHIHLVTTNSTTVESLAFQGMKERESSVLGGARGASWWQCAIKSRTRNAWNKEWGRIGYEGNLWWLGSKMVNWKTVMGNSWYLWILPIGRSESDGLDYPTNPRFDSEGRWMQRKNWPEELR